MINPTFEILNQRGTPMFFSDVFANRPTAAIVGRIFISTDTSEIYRDTGTAWVLIADGGTSSTNIYNANGTLTGNRVLTSGGFDLSLTPTTHIGTAAIGGGGTGKLIVGSSSSDNGLQVFGAISPSIRIDNAQSSATQRFIIGLATSTNNYIQGSLAGNFCITNASQSAILFGMWQTINATEVMRISTASNLLIGSITDTGQKLQVTGNVLFGSNFFWDNTNGRLGIGTNAPTQEFDLIGNAKFSGYVSVGNGSISAPSINFINSINTGFFYDSTNAGSLNFTLGGITLAKINNAPTITTIGQGNTFLGYNAGKVNFSTSTNAYNNTMIGGECGISNTSGFQNTFVGSRSGFLNLSGGQNTFVGQGAGYTNSIGSGGVMIGYHAGLNFNNTTTAGNTFIGSQAAQGVSASNGDSNVVIGNVAAYLLNSGSYNCIIGRNSMYSITSGADNVAIGGITGFSNTTGSRNIYIGKQSGYTATPANANVSGSDNIYIGYNSGSSTTTQLSNSIAIGTGSTVGTSNTFVYGNSSILTHIFESGILLLGSSTSTAAAEKLQITGTQLTTDTRTYSTGSIQTSRYVKNITIPSAATISSANSILTSVLTGTSAFQGSVSIPNSTIFATIYAANIYSIDAASITVTSTQAANLRAIAQIDAQNYFAGSSSGTFTHIASAKLSGYYNNNTGSITPTITNAYQLLINDIADYGHTFTFTNRWGIYQEGSNDRNYFAGNLMLNSTTDTGQKLQINGTIRVNGQTSGSAGGSSGQHLIINCDGTDYKIALLNT